MKKQKRFFRWEKENDGKLIFIVIPTVWFNVYNKGLQIKILRTTLAFLRFRLYFDVGKINIKGNDSELFLTNSSSSIKEIKIFLLWAKNKYNKDYKKDKIITKNIWNEKDFLNWIRGSSYKEIIFWNGLNYHYSKLIIFEQYFLYCQRKISNNKNKILKELD